VLFSDYRIVYAEILQYMWKFTSGDSMDIVSHIDKWRESLNRDVLRQLGHVGRRTDRR
jgi:DNA-binding ferritin-like protein (Dps family)